ncbi:MAG TPA: PqqD family peptide modification chaperone [Acidimicrobiales bacterium]|nr:PqqD family peptide modification chaperone [Acidimicrobiales bacterium]
MGGVADHAEIRRSPQAVYHELSDLSGGALYLRDAENCYRVNHVGAVVWALLEGGPTFLSLLAGLEVRFEDIPNSFREEIAAFILALACNGFVEINSPQDTEVGLSNPDISV